MTAIDFIRLSLNMSQNWVMGLVRDMQDAPLTFPTAKGGNHPLWVLGHLTYSEGSLVSELISGLENPCAEWKDLFNAGTEPSDDPSKYPSMNELFAKFEEVRGNTLRLLDTLTDADLDKPSRAPEEMKDFFGTIGACLAATIMHVTWHGGQVADARRAAGRKPLMG